MTTEELEELKAAEKKAAVEAAQEMIAWMSEAAPQTWQWDRLQHRLEKLKNCHMATSQAEAEVDTVDVLLDKAEGLLQSAHQQVYYNDVRTTLLRTAITWTRKAKAKKAVVAEKKGEN